MEAGEAYEASVERRAPLFAHKIANDSAFAVHVFRTIWDAQTDMEKFTQEHSGEHDGRGFQPHMTKRWNRLHDQLEANGWRFTPQELDDIREGMEIHAKQFIRLTDERLGFRREKP